MKKWSTLKAWGMHIAKRIGAKRAKVAMVRKITEMRRCIWVDRTPSIVANRKRPDLALTQSGLLPQSDVPPWAAT